MAAEAFITREGGAFPGAHRFTPRIRVARVDNLAVGLVTAAFAFALFSGEEMARGTLASLSLLAGLAAYGLYTLRARVRGLQTVEISDEALTVSAKDAERSIRWDQVDRAQHSYYGGDRWFFHGRNGAAVHLILDGYTPEEAARINSLIRDRLPEGV